MNTPFITRQHKYAVKRLKSGASRVYVQNAEALQAANFFKNTRIRTTYKRNRIEVRVDKNGNQKIMDTGRGELLELKNKDVTRSLGEAQFVSVTFRKNRAIIKIHGVANREQQRVSAFISKLAKGEPLRKGCFFSGLGMLSYSLSEGLAKQGIATEIAFANDNNELAMACNLKGNPMWQDATDDCLVLVDDINEAQYHALPQLDMVTIGYPCVGFSALAEEKNRDMSHPHCGTLFISLIAALRQMNPAVIIFENTPRFKDSQTLAAIEHELSDYQFSTTVLDGHDFNEIESRKRACVVAVSKSLPAFDYAYLVSEFDDQPQRKVKDMLEPMDNDDPRWREMAHVKARDAMTHLGYRNALYYGEEMTMTTLPASYGPAKAGVPMIAHPVNSDLQRQVTPSEHCNLRELPDTLKQEVVSVWKGTHPLVTKRGSFSAAHRLCGNGVSRRIWTSMGAAMGRYCHDVVQQQATSADNNTQKAQQYNLVF